MNEPIKAGTVSEREMQFALVIHVARMGLIRIAMETSDDNSRAISQSVQDRMDRMVKEIDL